MDILAELRAVKKLRSDTYSSAEVVGMVGRAADEIEKLRAWLNEASSAEAERARCLKIAEDAAAETADGDGEIYIARKIAKAIQDF